MNDHTTNESTDTIQYGYCKCGCGEKTKVAPFTHARRGWFKGEPLDYVHGHNRRKRTPPPAPRYCECGCGQITNVAPCSDASRGWVKGERIRYISGHGNGKPMTEVGPNPSGLCMCGCGKKTSIARQKNSEYGWEKGHYKQYVHGHSPKIPVEDRFWAKVNKDGPICEHLGTNCWDWHNVDGDRDYGSFVMNRKTYRANRASYILNIGPIPKGMVVMHLCDRPNCVNPTHLKLGTIKENMEDMARKGRNPGRKGDLSPHALFTNEQVRAFREEFDSLKLSIPEFARKHSVSTNAMRNLIQRKTYRNA